MKNVNTIFKYLCLTDGYGHVILLVPKIYINNAQRLDIFAYNLLLYAEIVTFLELFHYGSKIVHRKR
jgi:hypothetical protein